MSLPVDAAGGRIAALIEQVACHAVLADSPAGQATLRELTEQLAEELEALGAPARTGRARKSAAAKKGAGASKGRGSRKGAESEPGAPKALHDAVRDLLAALDTDSPSDVLLGDLAMRVSGEWDVATGAATHVRIPASTPVPAPDLRAERAAFAHDVPPAVHAPAEAVPQIHTAAELASMQQAGPEMAEMFISEALDHLSSIEALVLQLETTPEDTALLNDLFRPFHTIKGNAAALGVTSIEALAHKVENLLDLARSGRHRIGPAGIELVLAAVDLLTSRLRALGNQPGAQADGPWASERARLIAAIERLIEEGEDSATSLAADAVEPDFTPEPIAETAPKSESAAPTSVKIDTRKLDNLVDMVGELVIVQAIIQEDPALHALADEHLTRNLAQLRRITSELQRNAMSMRMVPIRQTFQKMSRLVRDLGRKSGKEVVLALSGEDTELDRKVVEDINDPLMHMVRNSVDHGIESAEVRARQGKRAAGRLSLSAYHQGGDIVIAIADDGAGLDTERILRKAVEQGIVSPQASLSPAEIHQLIFRAGFSTAERVTEISGRGVGMDVVRRNLEALRGRIDIHTQPGEGTTFEIRLPLTLAIIDGLLLGVGSQRFVLPTFSVFESLRPTPEQVHSIQGQPVMVEVRNDLLPMVRLADLFDIPGARCLPSEGTIVVVDDAGKRVALLVDQLLGKQEVVIKSLGEAFAGVRGIAGGAILGDGRIGLILDAHGLVGSDDGRAAA